MQVSYAGNLGEHLRAEGSIDPEKLPATLTDWVPEIAITAQVTDITVPRGFSPITIEGINGQVTLEKDVLLAENVQARVGPVVLPVFNIRGTGVADHFKLALRAKGPLQVAAAGDRQIEQLLLEHGLQGLDVSAPLHAFAPALGLDHLPLSGPRTLKGQLRVRSGSHEALLLTIRDTCCCGFLIKPEKNKTQVIRLMRQGF